MQPKPRDRRAAGRKAAITITKNKTNYYHEIGSEGGSSVEGIKRAFSVIPGLAARAVRRREELREISHDFTGYRYKVVTPTQPTHSCNSRKEARAVKRKLRAELGRNESIQIWQFHYDEFGHLDSERIIT